MLILVCSMHYITQLFIRQMKMQKLLRCGKLAVIYSDLTQYLNTLNLWSIRMMALVMRETWLLRT